MSAEGKFWATIVLGIAFAVVLLFATGFYFVNENLKIMTNAGYIETTAQGHNGVVWQKP